MPALKTKSAFSIGGAIKAHAKDPTEYGIDFTKPPPGIGNGIAKLSDIKFGITKNGDNKGQKFFYARGTIIEPEVHTWTPHKWEGGEVVALPEQTMRIAGLQTSIMINLCDTGKGESAVSGEEHVADMLNTVRTLAGEESTGFLETSKDPERDLETLFEQMVDPKGSPIYFKFATQESRPTKDYPNPRTWENWFGSKGLDDYQEKETGGMTDHTASPSTNGEAATPAAVEGPNLDEMSLEDVAALADSGDNDANARLTELALGAGMDEKAIEGAGSWAEIVAALQAEGGEQQEEWKPEKGKTYKYSVLDSKGKPMLNPRTKKPIIAEVEVTAVNEEKQTVNAKNLANQKLVYSAVPWDKLIRE